jgi:hypothetical protein
MVSSDMFPGVHFQCAAGETVLACHQPPTNSLANYFAHKACNNETKKKDVFGS